MPLLDTLFLFLFGHALADFVLQPDAMGYGKNRHDDIHDKEHSLFPNWWYWMSAHSLVHGGVVYVIAYSVAGSSLALTLALLETVAHWCTDFSKCERWISVHMDQAIHILFKIGYALILSAALV